MPWGHGWARRRLPRGLGVPRGGWRCVVRAQLNGRGVAVVRDNQEHDDKKKCYSAGIYLLDSLQPGRRAGEGKKVFSPAPTPWRSAFRAP